MYYSIQNSSLYLAWNDGLNKVYLHRFTDGYQREILEVLVTSDSVKFNL